VSGEMLARAREKAPEALVYQADMRELPVFGEFDLITCLDDALNYMLEEDELGAALRGIAANLAPDGLALWDLNTLAQYRGQFAQDRIVTDESTYIGWRADAEAAQVGAVVRIAIDVFTHAGDECWRRSTSVHRQRHWPRLSVERLCRRAGLELLDVRGQRLGALIDRELDELVHTKAIYVARPSERSDMIIGMP
jgi:hypothetical protein